MSYLVPYDGRTPESQLTTSVNATDGQGNMFYGRARTGQGAVALMHDLDEFTGYRDSAQVNLAVKHESLNTYGQVTNRTSIAMNVNGALSLAPMAAMLSQQSQPLQSQPPQYQQLQIQPPQYQQLPYQPPQYPQLQIQQQHYQPLQIQQGQQMQQPSAPKKRARADHADLHVSADNYDEFKDAFRGMEAELAGKDALLVKQSREISRLTEENAALKAQPNVLGVAEKLKAIVQSQEGSEDKVKKLHALKAEVLNIGQRMYDAGNEVFNNTTAAIQRLGGA